MTYDELLKMISNILYSYERMLVTREECDIMAREILERLEENEALR